MDVLINVFIVIGVFVILVLIIYLLDRVNTIEKETRRVVESMEVKAPAPKLPMAGLAGKRLWDAMTGKPPAGLGGGELEEVRERYDLVLHKHLEWLYKEGWSDSQRGLSADPPNTRLISTATAEVESWLPGAQVNTIYKCGLDAAQLPPEQWGPLRASMDEAAQVIYEKTRIEARQSLSSWLMPEPQPQSAEASQPTQPAPAGEGAASATASGTSFL